MPDAFAHIDFLYAPNIIRQFRSLPLDCTRWF